jgi:tRNA(Glu) U13 pseudouridine synthase TruD
LELQFTLPPGTYATVILRELCQYRTGPNSENTTS